MLQLAIMAQLFFGRASDMDLAEALLRPRIVDIESPLNSYLATTWNPLVLAFDGQRRLVGIGNRCGGDWRGQGAAAAGRLKGTWRVTAIDIAPRRHSSCPFGLSEQQWLVGDGVAVIGYGVLAHKFLFASQRVGPFIVVSIRYPIEEDRREFEKNPSLDKGLKSQIFLSLGAAAIGWRPCIETEGGRWLLLRRTLEPQQAVRK